MLNHFYRVSLFFSLLILAIQANAQPTVTLSSDVGTHTNSNQIPIEIDFSEEVYGFDSTDIEIENGEIEHFDSLTVLKPVNSFGSGMTYMVVDSLGNLYAFNPQKNNINVFDETGSFKYSFNVSEKYSNPTISHMSLKNDTIFILDTSNSKVQVYDVYGNFLYAFGEQAQFEGIQLIAVDDTYIYAGIKEGRYKKFTKTGDLVSSHQVNINGFQIDYRDMVVFYEELFFLGDNKIVVLDKDGNNLYNIPLPNYNGQSSSCFYIQRNIIYYASSTNIFQMDFNGNILRSDRNKFSSIIDIVVNQSSQIIRLLYDGTIQILGNDLIYTGSIAPDKEGLVTIQILSNSVTDDENVGNISSNMISTTYDITPPTAEISIESRNSNEYPIIFNFNFNEPVLNFYRSDISIDQEISKSEFESSLDQYRIKLWPWGNGNYNVKILKYSFTDLAGNFNTDEFNSLAVTFQADPIITTLTTKDIYATEEEVWVDVKFSEPVNYNWLYSFLVENAYIQDWKSLYNDDMNFQIKLIPTIDEGQIKVTLLDNSVTSIAGIYAQGDTLIINYDNINPLVYFDSEQISTTEDVVDILIYFDETVSEFTENDLIFSKNAEVISIESLPIAIEGIETFFHVKVKLFEEGEIVLKIREGVTMDLAGNLSEANSIIINYDNSRPILKIVPEYYYSDTNDFIINFFIEDLYPAQISYINFLVNDEFYESRVEYIGIENGILKYKTSISLPNQGKTVITISENSYTDQFGYGNIASNTVELIYDHNPLDLEISSYPGPYISNEDVEEVELSLIFNEFVKDFTLNDVFITGAEITSFTGKESKYLIVLKLDPYDEGIVKFEINENSLSDLFDINQHPKFEYFIFIDKSPPKINLAVTSINKLSSQTRIDLTVDDPVFNYNEDPIGCYVFNGSCFTKEDVIVIGGEIQNFRGNLDNFSFNLIPESRNVEIFVPEGVAFNDHNLGNSKSNVLKIIYPNIVLGADEENNLTPLHHWIDNYNFLNIKMEDFQSSADIYIVDVSGRTILKSEMNGSQWKGSLNGINAGVYLLYISSNNWVEKSKIFVK